MHRRGRKVEPELKSESSSSSSTSSSGETHTTSSNEFLPKQAYPPLSLSLLANCGASVTAFLIIYVFVVFFTGVELQFESNVEFCLIMVLGGLVGGGTPEAGNAVVFPLLSLGLLDKYKTSVPTSRDYGVLFQSVGLFSASVVIFLQRFPVDAFASMYTVLGSIPGMLLVFLSGMDSINGDYIRVFFSSTCLAFAFGMFLSSRLDLLSRLDKMGVTRSRNSKLFLIAIGFFGGCSVALVGSGVDVFLFAAMTVYWRCDMRLSQSTAVVTMAGCSIACVAIRSLQAMYSPEGDLFLDADYAIYEWWWVGLPVIIVMAPLGATLSPYIPRRIFLGIVVAIAVLQYMPGMFISESPSRVLLGNLLLILGSLIMQAMWRARHGRRDWAPAKRTRGTRRTKRAVEKSGASILTLVFAVAKTEQEFQKEYLSSRHPFAFLSFAFSGVALAYTGGGFVDRSLGETQLARDIIFPAVVAAIYLTAVAISILGTKLFFKCRRVYVVCRRCLDAFCSLSILLGTVFNCLMIVLYLKDPQRHAIEIMFLVVSIGMAPALARPLFRDILFFSPVSALLPFLSPLLMGTPVDAALVLLVLETVLFGCILLYIFESYARDNFSIRKERDEHAARIKEQMRCQKVTKALQIKAESSVQAERKYTAYIFHELRGPLGGVVEHMRFAHEMLKSSTGGAVLAKDAEKLFGDVSDAMVCCDHVTDILNSLLDFGKLDAEKMSLLAEETTPADIVSSCVKMLRHTVKPGVELSVVMDGNKDAPMVVDVTRVRQVVINLLSNAIKHTESGSITVTVTSTPLPVCEDCGIRKVVPKSPRHDVVVDVRQKKAVERYSVDSSSHTVSSSGGSAIPAPSACTLRDGEARIGGDLQELRLYREHVAFKVVVEDTGDGVPRELLPKVFDRYESRTLGGTGLGLPLAASFVELMKGNIRCRSPLTETGGTRFTVELPIPWKFSLDELEKKSLERYTSKQQSPMLSEPSRPLADADEEVEVQPRLIPAFKLVKEGEYLHPDTLQCLVVDDQEVPSRRIIVRRLETLFGWNIQITEAASGEEALEFFLTSGVYFHLITMDENMGTACLRGSEAIRRMRRVEENREDRLPPSIVISLTGNATGPDVQRYMGCGADLVWGKPLPQPHILKAQLSQLFRKRWGGSR